MAKTTLTYFCKNCGHESPKWLGKCPGCNEWNTFSEEPKVKSPREHTAFRRKEKALHSVPKPLSDIGNAGVERTIFEDEEFNRVLGGGLVPGSLILFGGEPGIGKSTLMLQLALHQSSIKTLYVSGEESDEQIRLRAERIGIKNNACYIFQETELESVLAHLEQEQYDWIILDSVQTLYSKLLDAAPGTITQVRECAASLLRYAKENGVPVVLIGHITKDGTLAGPKVLEHMVDTVLLFEGDRHYVHRLLRTVKNRFGPTHELGIYEMAGAGLIPVSDPSSVLTENRDHLVSGVAVGVMLEGIRPILIEVQALVSSAAYGTPQRSATGFDLRRLNMLLAVLEKRCGFRLGAKDVFLNITGGIRVEDPALDLAVVCAILSSEADVPLPRALCFSSEIGLTGELRPVNRIAQRVAEAARLGYKGMLISGFQKKESLQEDAMKIHRMKNVTEVFTLLFG